MFRQGGRLPQKTPPPPSPPALGQLKHRVLGTFLSGTTHFFLDACGAHWPIEEGCFVINICPMVFPLQITTSISIG